MFTIRLRQGVYFVFYFFFFFLFLFFFFFWDLEILRYKEISHPLKERVLHTLIYNPFFISLHFFTSLVNPSSINPSSIYIVTFIEVVFKFNILILTLFCDYAYICGFCYPSIFLSLHIFQREEITSITDFYCNLHLIENDSFCCRYWHFCNIIARCNYRIDTIFSESIFVFYGCYI